MNYIEQAAVSTYIKVVKITVERTMVIGDSQGKTVEKTVEFGHGVILIGCLVFNHEALLKMMADYESEYSGFPVPAVRKGP